MMRGMRTRDLGLLLVATAFFSWPAIGNDSIDQATSISGNQTRVSANGIFELGFFKGRTSGGSGGSWYVGIWYANMTEQQTVVWVANRQEPVVDAPGVLRLSADGRLAIIDGQNTTVWSSPAPSGNITRAATASLLDSGNFVVSSDGSRSPESVVWQSFDYPTDTLLPGMKLGVDRKNGIIRNITSCRGAVPTDDPSPGDCIFALVPGGLPEFFLFDKSTPIYTSGPWNGEVLTGVPQLKSQQAKGGFIPKVFWSVEETYYQYSISDPLSRARLVVDGTSKKLQRLWWESGSWKSGNSYPADQCDNYAVCGAFMYCAINVDQSSECSCLPGFKSQGQPGQQPFGPVSSKGCARNTNLTCGAGDGFWRVNEMKLPDATNATVSLGITLDQCRNECLGNCNCRAYAAANVSAGDSPGCVMWTVDLLDMKKNPGVKQYLYIRLAQSEIDSLEAPEKRRRLIRKVLIAVVTTVCSMLLVGCCCCFWRNKTKWKRHTMETRSDTDELPFRARKNFALSPARDHWFDENNTNAEEDLDLPLFDIGVIFDATDQFSANNKIGEGGFGPVYLGILEDGTEVAVKRLSQRSAQGVVEFKNEVKLTAMLQHRNLVRLLGCCIYDNERILVYEYMHNNSLDTFIFGQFIYINNRWYYVVLVCSTNCKCTMLILSGIFYR
ncbi:hypothetical protein GUJ93_ZPchr0001g29590 [Zizania palustris]|uniref:non-specific serine/threonine protein kinase n=1 Tax=Zizania palustris TaxID=103762 RepID=A0A8J5SCZ7_ZIZPA|nr:hypothetical protein GUJ93_ZPchr0001g29590 [Zizania palustris]